MTENIPNLNQEDNGPKEASKHRLLTATELPGTYYDRNDYATYDDYCAAFFDWESEELKNTTFSKDEAIALAHTSSRNRTGQNYHWGTPLYDEDDIRKVVKYILPLVPKNEQKEVLDDFISVLLDQVALEKEEDDLNRKQRKSQGKDSPWEFGLSRDADWLRHSITQHPELLTDEQFLKIIDKVPLMHEYEGGGVKDYSYLPAWVLYGMRLRYGYRDEDTKIIQAFDDETQKEKMKMVERYFSKVTVPGMKISTTEISPAEKEMLIEKVKEYALEIYKPIQSVTSDTPGAHFFTHVSNRSGLKCLLPKSSREDRWGNTDWTYGKKGKSGREPAVYLQRYGEFDFSQKKMLDEANGGISFTYPIYISEKDFKNHPLIFGDGRWDNGYMTCQPIMLDSETKFTWDILDRDMREHVIEKYEYHNGFLPADVKKILLSS